MTIRVSKPEFNLREKLSELDKPTGLKGTELMRSETTQEARDLINAGRRNKIINGAMRVAQRGTSESGVTSSGFKQTPDRWRINLSGPTVTVSQSTDSPDGFSHSYKIDITTADTSITGNDRLILQTRLEGVDLQDFAKGTISAKDFILSFYCKSTKMGTFTVELEDNDNTGDGGARSVSRHFTISNKEWNRYEINFGADNIGAFDADTGKSMTVFFWLMAGGTYAGGASLKDQWGAHIDNRRAYGTTNGADSTDNDFYFTGVQLEVGRNGGNATEFEHRPYPEELALCQRYFYKWSSSVAYSNLDIGYATDANNVDVVHQLPVIMRANPTMTISGTFRFVGYGPQDYNNISSISLHRSHPRSPYLRCATSGLSSGLVGEFGDAGSNNATMSFSAEL
jgi:hypothetical protein